jgi:FkbM family methyltransferase
MARTVLAPTGARRRLTGGVTRRAPERIQAWIRARQLTADTSSLLRYRSLGRLPRERDGFPETVEIALAPLHGHSVSVRPGTADQYAIEDTFIPPVHLPPEHVMEGDGPRRIWDLGSNIGLTIAHFAVLFPEAEIVGVEIDSGNSAICARNIAPWESRCRLIQAAVWHSDGEVSYAFEPGNELGFKVEDGKSVEAQEIRTVPAVSLDSLAEELAEGEQVDYVKMDIEGAEEHVLRVNTGWARLVRTIKVEVHSPYTVEECERDLRALGFEVSEDPIFLENPRGMPPVVGIRSD